MEKKKKIARRRKNIPIRESRFLGTLVFGTYHLLLAIIVGTAVGLLVCLVAGIKGYVVLTGSMEPAIPVGSLCVINQRVKFETIQQGDVISFTFGDGTLAAHRVVRKEEGKLFTKGDANEEEDEGSVTKDNYQGKMVLLLKHAGKLVGYWKTIYGKITFIGMIALVLLLGRLMELEPAFPPGKGSDPPP